MSARKWYSEELMAAIKERYTGDSDVITSLMNEFNVPRHIVTRYAKIAGLARKKEPDWSEKEVQYLIQNWSEKGLSYCAKRLKRTEIAVKLKAKRLGLGGIVKGSEYLSGQSVANILGIDIHSVLRWMDNGLLKYKNAPFSNRTDGRRTITMITLEDLEQFLRDNFELWDSRKLKGSLWIQEPEWMTSKRATDRLRPRAEGRKWTREEDRRAIAMFKAGGYTYQKIGGVLGRSGDSVERRLSRLDVWGTGEYIGARHERSMR
ncbi:SAM domain-containing protein [Paenibacillus zanthoxyli]|uniref:hypothetical protein n=1 Tax=Paenibacillus zanthoxyli TaxID=369399 RepID=UPI00046FE54D|nr:hypothetical protein [Paenibacillus zanthoxyli]